MGASMALLQGFAPAGGQGLAMSLFLFLNWNLSAAASGESQSRLAHYCTQSLNSPILSSGSLSSPFCRCTRLPRPRHCAPGPVHGDLHLGTHSAVRRFVLVLNGRLGSCKRSPLSHPLTPLFSLSTLHSHVSLPRPDNRNARRGGVEEESDKRGGIAGCWMRPGQVKNVFFVRIVSVL